MLATRRTPPNGGPRIYNLFPPLFGSVDAWRGQLPRIAGMGFDWIYLNPVHYPGFSGSLYALKDLSRLNDLFAVEGRDADTALTSFIDDAERRGLRVMSDLVVNHTSKDALLVDEHPEWYRREGGELYSPRVVDPDDPSRLTVWGDLAELDYDHRESRDGLIAYWSEFVMRQVRLGMHGFRCDAAYKIPGDVWSRLIAAAREISPGVVFFAETLGAPPHQMENLRNAGFDFFFNSSKWWDFRSDWLLDQYDRYRVIAPSIAFPESHDTERLAAEIGTDNPMRIAQHAKFRYLFAACFSTGVMIPAGFEYGFKRKLDVVHTRPRDWEDPHIDITDFIAATNAMKRNIPVLNEEGPLHRLTAPHGDVVALMREAVERNDGCAVMLINPAPDRAHTVDPGALLAETGGIYAGFEDVTPHATPRRLEPGVPLMLDALEMRVFRGEAVPEGGRPKARRAAAKHPQPVSTGRVAIENIWPEINGGRHAIKRIVGDTVEVWADVFTDGHEVMAAAVRYRAEGDSEWHEEPMSYFDNDRWLGRFAVRRIGRYRYTVVGWRDPFATWRRDVFKKRDAGQSISLEIVEGRALVERAAAESGDKVLSGLAKRLAATAADEAAVIETLLADEALDLMQRCGIRENLSVSDREYEVIVDRTAARYSAWYELFPRSMSDDPTRHGTFDDVIRHLPYIRDLGFNVLYMPPIHPIGHTNRKGRNNSLTAAPDDPGSTYAIGSQEGGHTAFHPELGDAASFKRLVDAARRDGIEIAIDFAIQVSPDHPWIREYPEWFDWRPDGTIRFAENPPKKYEDIVNVHFYGESFPSLWYALRDVVLFWIGHSVKIFRVDNPHTKPLPFWEWMIREVQDDHPEVIFLSEAFTRPKMMHKLAKVGFTQSYTYFTWRHTKAELTQYLTELSQSPSREYFRPNFFVNTPDINPPFLQTGGRPAFQIRAVLAATLASAWGMYSGFELCEATPIPGREEYLHSEKYEIKAWDWDRPGNIRDHIARLNRIRRHNPALHDFANLKFYPAYDDRVLFYGKATPSRDNIVWIAVNLDPYAVVDVNLELPFSELNLDWSATVEAEDLLAGGKLRWQGNRQRVRLDPQHNPCAIWRVTPPSMREA
ncbi:MAG TPA: maltotransferase domain-containing protein [Alphaproteobacteria bacterium]|nr:maltotransferase domain-containing protein [Alphaproteobacteria bacterium]